jgi:Zn-dependent peptidase ImmA (M78 family)
VSPAAQLANLVAQKLSTGPKPDLNDVCKKLGLRIKEVPATGFDGALVRSRSAQKGIVAVNVGIREQSRKRFTVAHEIGHFVMPHHRLLGNICEQRSIESFSTRLQRPEIEANEFAAEFLLPSAVLRHTFNLREFSLAQISAVANDFEASLTATTRCFLNLTDLPCALVWSVSGNARWLARSATFRFFLPLEDLPGPASFAAKLFNGVAVPSDFAAVQPDAWLNRPDAESVETLLEHSVFLPNYDAVLTLLWAYRVHAVPAYDDEEELLEEMNPENFTLGRQRWPR